ncbi:hypothetical protein LCGC14_2162570 [marine sediment metagenome]|uniref:Glycosyl transferase family 3 domain-containing protein n=1 Tax=marine sediment metagenome TaxID=412755 RepID=A0A0F9DSE4_9ZZZZ
MKLSTAIKSVMQRRDLSSEDMMDVMQKIMTGQATSAQIGGFLVGLQMKGETITEIAAAAKVMRSLVTPVEITGDHIVDTCGTGGDGASTFNVSTASAFVVAAAGAKVAKHGNRSITSSSGSADVLEAAGINLDITPTQVKNCIDNFGVCFMFAQKHHGAMKYASGPRNEMGVRTIFNLLGPLTNPAKAKRQVLGVYDRQWVEPMAHVLKELGSEHVLIVHAEDGLDEIELNALLDLLLENIRESKILKLKQFSLINPNNKGIQSGFMIQNNKVIKIKLVNYGLVTIPESIGFLEKLENLDLSHNRIKTIPESIGLLKNLKKLKLSINQIQNIPETIGNLISLRIIKLDHNQLTKLPDSIKNLNFLEFLSLWSNHLVTLPEGIGDLKSLQVIGLSFNNLITIPDSITKLKLIQTLDLSNNHLTKIPEKIGDLKSLQVLWLNDNYLEALPISILSIKYLKQLYLFSNPCVIHPDTEMRYLLDKLQQNDVNVK